MTHYFKTLHDAEEYINLFALKGPFKFHRATGGGAVRRNGVRRQYYYWVMTFTGQRSPGPTHMRKFDQEQHALDAVRSKSCEELGYT